MSPRASSSLRAESTVFLSMLHSSAMSRRDGKQLSVFLSLCLSKQQYTTNSFGFSPSSNIWLGTMKKFLCFILPPDDKTKRLVFTNTAFTETPISERHSFAKNLDAPCRYVSTSLLTQISFEDHRTIFYVYSEELIWHLIHLFDFEAHIFVRGFILTQDFRFVNSFFE